MMEWIKIIGSHNQNHTPRGTVTVIEYRFNRRRLVDQSIFVRASSLDEAWKKARETKLWDAGDDEIVGTPTFRYLDEQTVEESDHKWEMAHGIEPTI